MADPDGTVRFAVMGAGLFGGAMIGRINAAAGCRVMAIASRDRAKAVRVAAEHGLGEAAGCSYRELAGRADVDAVYVAVPNHLHVPWAVELLGAGKHVLSEKPLSWDRAGAARAFDAAERAGRVLAEGFMYFHHPQTDEVSRIVRRAMSPGGDELVGELIGLRARREWKLDDRPEVVGTRFSRSMHGGALMDLGVYALSWPRWVSGRGIEGLELTGATLAEPLPGEAGRVDGACSWRGALAGTGVWVEGSCSMLERGSQDVEVVGTAGTLWTGWAWSPDEGDGGLWFTPSGGAVRDGSERRVAVDAGAGGVVAGRAEAQFSAFARAVRGEGEAVPGRSFSEAHAGAIGALYGQMGVSFEPVGLDGMAL